jgi:uncharacterized damage-inducible protein DinB
MPILSEMLQEFNQEMGPTRKVLERVPSERGEWKPHPKSFPLGHLAQLVSWMPGWVGQAMLNDKLDLGGSAGYSYEPTEQLLAEFDKGVKETQEAFETGKNVNLDAIWSLTHGERVLFSAPRGAILRNHINHLVHHRAQLGVYLRLLDVPVPSMYGPTADERQFLG